MRAWPADQRAWLTVEYLPACATDLNPVEGLLATLKGVELANRACRSLQLAPKTVRNPASSVFAKLQVADRALNPTPKTQ